MKVKVNGEEVEIGEISDLIKDENFAKSIQSLTDGAISKAVEAYKEKGFKTAVEQAVEERLKAKETKTPEQIKLEEYNTKLAAMENKLQEKERTEMKLKNKTEALSKFKDAGLPDSLIDFFVSEDSEITNKNLETAVSALTEFKTKVKQETLGDNKTKVPGANTKTTGSDGLKEPGAGASVEEWKAYYKQKK